MIDEKQKESPDDVLTMIYLRNSFYQKKYYFALGIYLLSIVVIIVLSGMLYYLVKKPTQPIYFVADKVGRLLPDMPLQVPNMSADDVAAWVTHAMESTFSYDYINYREQLQSAQVYFTDYGWNKYMDGLKATNNLVALEQRKFIITAQVIGKPKLVVQGLLSHTYAWKFEVPLLVTYLPPPYDGKSQFQNPLLLTVIVQRQKILSSNMGLGIVQMIGTLATTPQQPNLSAVPS